MLPDTNQIYQQARLSRDPRFDGKFFIAVKSTGIFCRTICPARLPLEKNVEYYDTKEEAISAGYRPCLRCKPEFSPSYDQISHRSDLVSQAIALIKSGAMLTATVAEIAAAVFTSPRNLNKAFNLYYGIPLKQFQDINKALFAKKLLFHSDLTIAEISDACGYSNINGLYRLINKHLKIPVRKLKNTSQKIEENHLVLKIPFVRFYNWKYFLEFQSQRLINKLESIQDQTYQRVVTISGISGTFKIRPGEKNFTVILSRDFLTVLPLVMKKIAKVFDLETNTSLIESQFRELYPSIKIESGLHIPGVFSAYEAGIRAICGQQVSVSAAIKLLNQFVEIFSQQDPAGRYLFPLPADISRSELNKLKTMESKKNTLYLFSQWCTEHDLNTETDSLIKVKGIGKWTIEYIKLRGLNESDVWIDSDLGVKKIIEKHEAFDAQAAIPWRSYLSIHLWNNL